MKRKRWKKTVSNLFLFFGSLLICFIVTEAGYRIFDPYPFFDPSEINRTEYGNLSTYDPILGWKGVPSAEVEFVTQNRKVWLAHNRDGFRDIEHRDLSGKRPAIVFLGDSFTWGYEVEFEEMFVNRLREMLPDNEIYNLSHRGYGTDQSLLIFRDWHEGQPIKLVVLMFSENDVEDNNSNFRNKKPKPKFRIVGNELVLGGVPVPRGDYWERPPLRAMDPDSWESLAEKIFFRSHFLHDLSFRYEQFFVEWVKENDQPDLTLTGRILEELKKDVEGRGAMFVVGFIPSKLEIEELDSSTPYQADLVRLCRERGIECLDLAPAFKNVWLRTYYRNGFHWTARGHKVASEALSKYIKKILGP